MRVVDFDADVFDTDRRPGLHGGDVLDGAEPEVAAQDVGWTHLARPLVPVAATVADAVEAFDEHGHPADAPLGHGDLQVGMLDRVPRPQPLGGRGERQLAKQCRDELHPLGAGVFRRVVLARRADVQGDDRFGLRTRLDDRVPVPREQTR